MRMMLSTAVVALVAWSCGPQCQEFHSDDVADRARNTRLGIGFPDTVVVGYATGELAQMGALPPGMSLAVSSDGKIIISGTPTTAGEYQLELRPKTSACVFKDAALSNIIVDLSVAAAQCDDNSVCRLLGSNPCTQSTACTPSGLLGAACVHSVGDAGVCVDSLGPNDGCSGAVSVATVSSVEGAQIRTCIATPAITGCNHHVCYGPPES